MQRPVFWLIAHIGESAGSD